jgi:hypothetical protein
MRETLGARYEQSTAVDFKTEPVTLGDLQAAIQDLAGPKGWGILLKKAIPCGGKFPGDVNRPCIGRQRDDCNNMMTKT